MDMIQRRRDHQAGGRPLWTIDLVPGQLGDGGWTMFACHATDTHLIPTAHLDTLRSHAGPR